MYKLLPVSVLLHIVTGSVYTVIPDDHYYRNNTTCHHCHNLQHYLLNTTKYFNSNTQLLFLPGLHHLNTDLIVQNAHNISLIGSTTNGTTPDTVIQCNSSDGIVLASAGIVMIETSNITLRNIVINNCKIRENHETEMNSLLYLKYVYLVECPSLFLQDCYDVHIHNVVINSTLENTIGLSANNVLGEFSLVRVKSIRVSISYDDGDDDDDDERSTNWSASKFHLNHKLRICQFELIPMKRHIHSELCKLQQVYSMDTFPFPFTNQFYSDNSDYEECLRNEHAKDLSYGIQLNLYQSSYNVSIILTNMTFKQLRGYQALSVELTYKGVQ
ncbi:uncharacterized protein [Dysidea avara]|uniref:uncharacterized protein n=1 Tax=Dysidea avara TaxID=196820 RepID=UPI00332B5EFD